MRKTLFISWIVLATTALALAKTPPATQPLSKTPPGKLVVHEWGTFTSFAGSDGVYLDYRPLINADLPKFVFDRDKQMALTHERAVTSAALGEKFRTPTRSRMETPVTYFYTDQPMPVEVRVDFPNGLFTEFYPPARAMAPLVAKDEKSPRIGKAYLDWGRFTVLPPASAPPEQSRIPAVTEGDRYAAARQTDSDIVQFTDVIGNVYQEKFLFYRGIGSFEIPVQIKAAGRDEFTITNQGPQPLAAAFLINIDQGKVRFARVTNVAKQMNVSLPAGPGTLDALANAMTADLIVGGLYEKEAQAMVKTWESSWFGEEGTRLLYLMPRTQTDALIPLSITPTPQETVRVMVGRLETLTPEREGSIGKLILGLGADDFRSREEAMRQIKKLGRFAEPTLQRVSASSDDPEIRTRAQMLLGEIRSGR